MSVTKIDTKTLELLIDMANSHIEDIDSGVEDGTYSPLENTDLVEKEKAVMAAKAAIKGSEGIELMVDASAGHLTWRDRQILKELADAEGRVLSCPRVAAHEYGWCLFLSGEADTVQAEIESLREQGGGDGLLELIRYGNRHGAYILNFDQDADMIESVVESEEDSKGVRDAS